MIDFQKLSDVEIMQLAESRRGNLLKAWEKIPETALRCMLETSADGAGAFAMSLHELAALANYEAEMWDELAARLKQKGL